MIDHYGIHILEIYLLTGEKGFVLTAIYMPSVIFRGVEDLVTKCTDLRFVRDFVLMCLSLQVNMAIEVRTE